MSDEPTSFSGFRDEMLREFRDVKQKQDHTNGRLRDVELWRAKVGGFLLALTVFSALPATVAAVAAVYTLARGG